MSSCSVMGVITQVMPVETGTSESSGQQWSRQTIVVKKITNSQYEQYIALDISGQNIQKVNAHVGVAGEFFFDPISSFSPSNDPSRSGRWFTSLKCFNFKPFQATPQQMPPQQSGFNPQGSGNAPQTNRGNQGQGGFGW